MLALQLDDYSVIKLHGQNPFFYIYFNMPRFSMHILRIPVKTVSHFGFIRSLYNLPFSHIYFYPK